MFLCLLSLLKLGCCAEPPSYEAILKNPRLVMGRPDAQSLLTGVKQHLETEKQRLMAQCQPHAHDEEIAAFAAELQLGVDAHRRDYQRRQEQSKEADLRLQTLKDQKIAYVHACLEEQDQQHARIAEYLRQPNLTARDILLFMAALKRDAARAHHQRGLMPFGSEPRPAETMLQDSYHVGLSIDGGGMRGIIPALFLQKIEEETRKRIYELVDFVGGTSIGGILALGLTAPKPNAHEPFSATELVSIFRDRGTRIFPYNSFRGLKQIFTNVYRAEGIETVLQGYFGLQHTLRDVRKPVLVTALTTSKTSFVFESSKARLNPMHNFFLKDVARATSAAPTFFPAAKIRSVDGINGHELVDGGVWCNNPSRLVHDALLVDLKERYGPLAQRTAIVSLGTGESPSECLPANAGLCHAGPIVDAMMDSHSHGINQTMQVLLGERFYRVQPALCLPVELDETRPEYLDFMEACAEERYDEVERISRFLLQNFDLRREG